MDFGEFAMKDAELAALLTEKPRFASLASLRKDGSPFVITLGYLYEAPWMYFTFAPDRSVAKRLRRDPRVASYVKGETIRMDGAARHLPAIGMSVTK